MKSALCYPRWGVLWYPWWRLSSVHHDKRHPLFTMMPLLSMTKYASVTHDDGPSPSLTHTEGCPLLSTMQSALFPTMKGALSYPFMISAQCYPCWRVPSVTLTEGCSLFTKTKSILCTHVRDIRKVIIPVLRGSTRAEDDDADSRDDATEDGHHQVSNNLRKKNTRGDIRRMSNAHSIAMVHPFLLVFIRCPLLWCMQVGLMLEIMDDILSCELQLWEMSDWSVLKHHV